MKAWIANASLAKKLSIAPFFAVLGLSSLAFGSYLILQSLRSDVEYLNQVAFARAQQVAKLRSDISRAQTKLYDIAAYSANSQNAGTIDKRRNELARFIQDVRKQRDVLAQTDPQAAHRLDTGIKTWDEQATGAAEMMASDAALGLTFMAPAEDAFSALDRVIEQLGAESDAARGETFDGFISKISSAGRGSVILILFFAVALTAVTLKLTAAIKKPISRLTDMMSRLASGDLSTDVEGAERGDEIGAMARAVLVFKEGAVRNEGLEKEKRASLERQRQRGAALESAVTCFDTEVRALIQTLVLSANELSAAADSMSLSSTSANEQALSASHSVMESSQQMQTMASSAEQLSSTIHEISRQMQVSSNMTSSAAESVRIANRTIDGLAQDATRINEVVMLIHQIARKTNLLALNATIEAGRAGAQGKGFAIVASEVKELANRTAEATETIGSQVAAIQDATNSAVQAIREIGSTIDNVDLAAATMASAVEEQQAATRTISDSVAVAAKGADHITARIMELTDTSGEVGKASSVVSGFAKDLLGKAESLRLQVDQFLSVVRAA